MGFTASEDLKTLLDAHSSSPGFASNSDLDGEPFIKLIDDGTEFVSAVTHRIVNPEDGQIVIGEENLSGVTEWVYHANESYRILLDVSFQGQTTSTKLKALLSEIRSAFVTENRTVDREYYWKMTYLWGGLVQEGAVTVVVDAQKQWVTT